MTQPQRRFDDFFDSAPSIPVPRTSAPVGPDVSVSSFIVLGVNAVGPMALLGFVDGYQTEEHTSRLRKTQYPIETGATLVDHAVNLPKILELVGWVSDVKPLRYKSETSTITHVAPKPGPERAQTAWQEILKLQSSRIPVRVLTFLGAYDNMLITDASASVSKRTGRGMGVVLTFEEVLQGQLVFLPEAIVAPDNPAVNRLPERNLGIINNAALESLVNPWWVEDVNVDGFVEKEYYYPFYSYTQTEAPVEFTPRDTARDKYIANQSGAALAFEGGIFNRIAGSRVPTPASEIGQVQFRSVPITADTRQRMVLSFSRPQEPSDVQLFVVSGAGITGTTVVVNELAGVTLPSVVYRGTGEAPLIPVPLRTEVNVRLLLYWNTEAGSWEIEVSYERPLFTGPDDTESIPSTVTTVAPISLGAKIFNDPYFDEDIVFVPRLGSPDELQISIRGDTLQVSPARALGGFTMDSIANGEVEMLVLTARQSRHWVWPPVPETEQFFTQRQAEEMRRPLR